MISHALWQLMVRFSWLDSHTHPVSLFDCAVGILPNTVHKCTLCALGSCDVLHTKLWIWVSAALNEAPALCYVLHSMQFTPVFFMSSQQVHIALFGRQPMNVLGQCQIQHFILMLLAFAILFSAGVGSQRQCMRSNVWRIERLFLSLKQRLSP